MSYRPTIAAFLVLLGITTVGAQAQVVAPATKPATKITTPPLPAGVKAVRDVEYIAGGGPSQSLDIYLPEKAPERPLPLVVWIHGGGWRAGSKAGCPGVYLVEKGYIVASVEYRFCQKAVFPAQIQDCKAAVRFLRANAAKYHIDPNHVGVWGASAGGHLVALLGTTGGSKDFAPIGGNEDQSDKVQAVCDWFGPANFHHVMEQAKADKTPSVIKFNTPQDPYSGLIGVDLGKDEARDNAVSPTHHANKESAPILIIHGDADALVPYAQSVELMTKLRAADVEVILQRMPNSGHGGPAFYRDNIKKLIADFFEKELKGAKLKVEALPDAEVTVPPPAAKKDGK
jgi:acetyl esterase/lipase